MELKYETRAERVIRIGQWIATAFVLIIVAAGIMAGMWGLGLPDPSQVHP
jgi:hypothetical protein